MRRCAYILSVLTAVLAVTAAGSADAANNDNYSFGSNVDPALVSAISSDQASGSDANTRYHVLVFAASPDLKHALSSIGVQARNDLDVLGAQSATVTAAQAAALSAQGVAFVTTDTPMVATGKQADSTISAAQLATLYPQVDGAPTAWANGTTGSGVGIAVIDSGVTPRADFGDRLVQVTLPTQDGTQLNDSVGHGSVVAGIAAGQSPDGKYIGIAPGASVYAINVARADGVYTSDVIAGISWVLDNAKRNHIGVVNLSLSQVTPSSYYSNTLDAAIDQLWKQGIVVVTSAGNLGAGNVRYAPANDPWVITVGASDTNDTATTADDTLASFSSSGMTPDGFTKPEIVAPGRHIVGPIPRSSTIAQEAPSDHILGTGEDNYVKISGTSFSAPQVAGAVALLLQQHPDISPDQVKWVLTHNERSTAGSDAGALDVAAASVAVQHPSSANVGLRWSQWIVNGPGQQTSGFKATVSGIFDAYKGDSGASRAQAAAQAACLKANSVPVTRTAKTSSAFNDCAQRLESAAAAWDKGAELWDAAPSAENASNDEQKSSIDYYLAAWAWTTAGGNAGKAAADTAINSAAWDKAAAWDQADALDHAAAWDAAAWDKAATWDKAAAWDAAAWDKAAAWDAAAWDKGAAWDAAAWDAAAWDAAAWDAAAWD